MSQSFLLRIRSALPDDVVEHASEVSDESLVDRCPRTREDGERLLAREDVRCGCCDFRGRGRRSRDRSIGTHSGEGGKRKLRDAARQIPS